MKRREILRKSSAGLVATVGLIGTASADDCGSCEEQYCYCDGEWVDCPLEPGDCCDGTIRCNCVTKCECGGPCQDSEIEKQARGE